MEQLGIADLLYRKESFRGPACYIPPWVEVSDLPHLQKLSEAISTIRQSAVQTHFYGEDKYTLHPPDGQMVQRG